MVAPIRPARAGQTFSVESAAEALTGALGAPGTRGRLREPRWRINTLQGGAWFELRDRAGTPVLVIEPDRAWDSDLRGMLFVELRGPEDVRLFIERSGVQAQEYRRQDTGAWTTGQAAARGD